MKITLIGLGMCEGDLTLRAKSALDDATKIIARTANSDSFKSLKGYEVETLDCIFEKCRNFDTLNAKLASAVLKAAKQEDVCYCVDGGVCEDEACKIILSKHRDCVVYDTVSKAAHAYSAAKLTSCGVVNISAYSVDELKSCAAVCVYDVDCDLIAGEVKQKLSYLFGEEKECVFIRGTHKKIIKIYELDRQKDYDATCAVAVQESEFLKKDRYDYADLLHMLELLRAPDGCPWDRVQTPESIKGNMIEEAYELVDAIERADADGIEEETGDVLMQAAFHSVLQSERGCFTGGDALTRVVKKLIFRHSHIFGGDKAASESEALGVWENNKKIEKGMSSFSQTVLAVPKNFPSCMYAQKVQKRASKSGMDFTCPEEAAKKLAEEVEELLCALKQSDGAAVCDEAGDVLFSAVNVCRLSGADSENALRASALKFAARFVECEKLIAADGREMTSLYPSELDKYWEKAKRNV